MKAGVGWMCGCRGCGHVGAGRCGEVAGQCDKKVGGSWWNGAGCRGAVDGWCCHGGE